MNNFLYKIIKEDENRYYFSYCSYEYPVPKTFDGRFSIDKDGSGFTVDKISSTDNREDPIYKQASRWISFLITEGRLQNEGSYVAY